MECGEDSILCRLLVKVGKRSTWVSIAGRTTKSDGIGCPCTTLVLNKQTKTLSQGIASDVLFLCYLRIVHFHLNRRSGLVIVGVVLTGTNHKSFKRAIQARESFYTR